MRLRTYGMVVVFVLHVWKSSTTFGQEMLQGNVVANQEESLDVTYEMIQPVLRKHCLSCHNDEETRGNLSLASPDKIAAGSASGPVVVSGKVQDSPLYLVTAHLDNPKMPPNKPRIPQRDLQLLEKWIRTGASKDLARASSPAVERRQETETPSRGDNTSLWESFRPFPRLSPLSILKAIPESQSVCLMGLEQVCWYDLASESFLERAVSTGNHAATGIQWSASDKTLWVAKGVPGELGELAQIDIDSGKTLQTIGREGDTIATFELSVDTSMVAIGTRSKQVLVYSTKSGKLLCSLSKHTDWITSIAFSRDGLLLASADRFGTIHVWDAASGAEFATLRGHVGAVTSLIWSDNGDRLYSTGWDGIVRIWNLHQAAKEDQWLAQPKGVLGMKCSSGKRFLESNDQLITYGRDGDVVVWDLISKKALSCTHFDDEVIQLEVVPSTETASNPTDGTALVTTSDGGLHKLSWKSSQASSKELTLPVERSDSFISIRRPPAIVRRLPTADMEPLQAEKAGSLSLLDDLADTKRALQSVQSAKQSLIATLSELEESEARIKQVMAIQEARMKQVEWKEKGNKK